VIELLSDDDSDEDKGSFAFLGSPKFYLVMVQNVSVFLAFSGLLKFYHAVRDEIT
jgi:hypothetical protein